MGAKYGYLERAEARILELEADLERLTREREEYRQIAVKIGVKLDNECERVDELEALYTHLREAVEEHQNIDAIPRTARGALDLDARDARLYAALDDQEDDPDD